MSAQKTKTDNGKSKAQLVSEARKEAQTAGGNLAEAILRYVDRSSDQLRCEDIAAVDKKAEDNRSEISSLKTAHAGLSRKQAAVEKSQKEAVKKVEQVDEDTKKGIEQLKEKLVSVSNGLGSARGKSEENAEKIKEIEKLLGKKLTEEEVQTLIGEALEIHTRFRDNSLEQRFVTLEDAEKWFATKGEVNQLNDGYVTIRDTVNESLEVSKDAYTTAVEAQAMAEGANTQANGAYSKADEISSDVHDIRTSMAPQPAKETPEVPEEAKSAPGSIAVTKTEVENMIKQAGGKIVAHILERIADVAEFVDSPKEMADSLREEINEIFGNDSGDD